MIHSLYVNDNFSKFITGSKNGEIYLTDIYKSCYCKVDKIENEPITSLTMTDNLDIIATTSKNKIYEYNFKNKNVFKNKSSISPMNGKKQSNALYKQIIQTSDNNNNITVMRTNFSNEIIRYHQMKNKIYIFTINTNAKVFVYNVIKLQKIAEFQLPSNVTFDKLLEIIDKYDLVTLKTWFNVDIKLGVLSITFQNDNLFINTFNFDIDYMEKVLDATSNLTKIIPVDFKFLLSDINSVQNSPMVSNLSSTMDRNSYTNFTENNRSNTNFSSTMPVNSKKNTGSMQLSAQDKLNSVGHYIIKVIFDSYSKNARKKYIDFYENNFWDTRDYIKTKILKIDPTVKNNLNNTTLLHTNTGSVYFIFSTSDNCISSGPYLNEINSSFKIPNFTKQLLQLPSTNIDVPKPKSEKIDVVIDNSRREIKILNKNENDELEIAGVVTALKFKEWLMKNYIDVEWLKNEQIKSDLKTCNLNKEVHYFFFYITLYI